MSSPNKLRYLDPALCAEQRADLLLAEMTLEEKVGQMCQYAGETPETDASNPDEVVGYTFGLGERAELVRLGRVGSFLKVPGAAEANELQALAAQSRLKIPLLIATDAIHGHAMDVAEATVFPTPIGIASSFDVSLAERIARCTARELRVTGFHWTFSPNVDVVIDARWGRTGETFGEDPLLVGRLGAAMVVGYQGDDFSGQHEVLACAKHLVGGGAAENGLNGASAELSERSLREVFYPPFIEAVQAGVFTVMPAHNDVAGVPCHADRRMLTGLLRETWGFAGIIVSDWNDLPRLETVHGVATCRKDADRLSVLAGLDVHMQGGEFLDNVLALVQEGQIPLLRIDQAVKQILVAKFRLGLFEERASSDRAIAETVLCPEHRLLALEASRKAIVLLKNDGVLPLERPGVVLVTGPCADDQSTLGDWSRPQPAGNVTTVLSGLRSQAPKGVTIEYIESGPITAMADHQIHAACQAAAAADVVVAVVGENSLRHNPDRTSGENIDRACLDLQGRQLELLAGLAATGTPLVVVLVNGAPIASEWVADNASAIIEAWEPGMCGGTAVAEVIFGHINPSGRLPITVPRSVGHVRQVYNHRPAAFHRSRFRFSRSEPLYAFGTGLSYTTFSYLELRLPESAAAGEALSLEVDIQNTGARAGEEIVLVYVRDVCASVTRPVKALKAFARLELAPGETKTVNIELPAEAFSLLDVDLQPSIEPGEFRVMVGSLERSVWLR